MQLIAILSTLGAALVAATPVQPVPRACSQQYPASIGLPINYSISNSINPPGRRDNAISFMLPPQRTGPCSLVVQFPAGYPIQQSGASQVNIIDVNGPSAGSIVGTVTFSSDPNAPTRRTINSFECRDTMTFLMQIASTEQDGSVSFQEVLGAGLVMEYGC